MTLKLLIKVKTRFCEVSGEHLKYKTSQETNFDLVKFFSVFT